MADNNTQSLYNFMSQLNKNSVRTKNLFEMRVFVPDNVRGHYSGNALTKFLNPNFTFYGTGFQLPARSLNYEEVAFKGFKVPVPTTISMTNEHDVTINADINGDMRRAFLAWQALTINPQINQNGGYFEGNRLLKHSGKLYVSMLDPTYEQPGKIIETYTIYGVTVADVGVMEFSNSDATVATFSVKFRSQYWQYGINNGSDINGAAGAKEALNPNGGQLEFSAKSKMF